MIEDPAAIRVAADLVRADLLAGVENGRWRILKLAFPYLDVAISATEPDGGPSEYVIRFELSNFPALAPLARIWNVQTDQPLAVEKRPKGGKKLTLTFQKWGEDTIYRPWDRLTGPHNPNAPNLSHLAWHSGRTLTFALEDLHGILNLNARSLRYRSAA